MDGKREDEGAVVGVKGDGGDRFHVALRSVHRDRFYRLQSLCAGQSDFWCYCTLWKLRIGVADHSGW